MSEICTIKISIADLAKLKQQGVQYTLKIVEETDFDYSNDEKWNKLKKASIKAYMELKNREFDLRHNQ